MGRPAPCLYVDRDRGYAVVPDVGGRTQVLLVPTVRLRGIESPRLLARDSENYWQAAWAARRFVERRAGRAIPRDDLALAINSAYSRSQEQLHIHVDCVRRDVRLLLKAQANGIGRTWSPFPSRLAGGRYMVRRLASEDLVDHDPFKLLARGVAGARAAMGTWTLVVVGAVFDGGSPGFYILATNEGTGFGESLLDHRCEVLRGM
jgi:CDP-diacylglycerol pyrophosphatase